MLDELAAELVLDELLEAETVNVPVIMVNLAAVPLESVIEPAVDG